VLTRDCAQVEVSQLTMQVEEAAKKNRQLIAIGSKFLLPEPLDA
jgi:hypothetical protein